MILITMVNFRLLCARSTRPPLVCDAVGKYPRVSVVGGRTWKKNNPRARTRTQRSGELSTSVRRATFNAVCTEGAVSRTVLNGTLSATAARDCPARLRRGGERVFVAYGGFRSSRATAARRPVAVFRAARVGKR